ncbi:hypothetical protein L6164_030351 [Bauhinia variegata]|uniref:Uncharacterized protein n=1 Tax=Bauhinia variegata TaxID=167791 RepID=A0ACB9LCD4_BAUVA|nr:hypothetical protein L6164_030351 [Bauhinia variegata]
MKQLEEALHFICSPEFWRMAILWTISLVLSYWQLFKAALFSKEIKSYRRCSPSTTPIRPVCVITGATSGLGAATAYTLSKEGYAVAIVGRSLELLSETIRNIKDRNEDAYLEAFQADLSSIQSIMKFKISLQQWLLDSDLHFSVQLLINNAGILATSHRLTAEGYDQMIGTNYIGAFALTKLLLPLLESSPIPARIVNVTSFTHRNVANIQVDNETVSGKSFLSSNRYPCAHIYEYSKLCVLLFSYELHRQLQSMEKSHHISVIAADPGVVQTNIMREVPSILSYLAFTVLRLLGLLQYPEGGISSIVDAALAPPEASGVYFFGGKGGTINSSALSRNTKLAHRLWETTCNLLSQTPYGFEETWMLPAQFECHKENE